MKAIRIPKGFQAHFSARATENIFGRESLCVPSHSKGHTGELYLLRALLSPLGAPGWSQRVVGPDLSDLETLYEIGDSNVALFLNRHDFLIDLLNEGASIVQNHFGADAKVRLEVSSDPDNGGDRELFARVLTHLSPREAVEILGRFDEDWWLDASVKAKCLLNFALRYV